MDDLIDIVRTYIEDETSPYSVSDAIITRWLNSNRGYIHELVIYSEDYAYDDESKVYHLGYNYISNLVLEESDDTVIADTNYTVDVFNGIVTFDDDYTIPDVVYATFNFHDFFDAVANLWKYRAGLATFSGKAQLGDEVIPLDKYNREYCLMKYWDFMQSRSYNMER